jgi:hypothetical protein
MFGRYFIKERSLREDANYLFRVVPRRNKEQKPEERSYGNERTEHHQVDRYRSAGPAHLRGADLLL